MNRMDKKKPFKIDVKAYEYREVVHSAYIVAEAARVCPLIELAIAEEFRVQIEAMLMRQLGYLPWGSRRRVTGAPVGSYGGIRTDVI